MSLNNISLLPTPIVTYLNKFSFSNWKFSKDDVNLFDNIIVIPSLAEFEKIFSCLNSIEQNNKRILERTLVILVINNSEKASSEIVENNRKTFQHLASYTGKLNINFIDAFSEGNAIPQKLAGVGFARKIGLDLALTKFDYQSPNKKILIWLDADCEVESNYLEVVTQKFKEFNFSAAVIEYEHKIKDDDPESQAIVCYETFLRYFRLALIYANSHYDYHAIGSTIVCSADAYIKVGGMNSKQAGEDFYFLEKQAKQNKVVTIKETLVYPSSRKSWRVPFGTGQRINRFLKNLQDEYLVYNPNSFEILKNWLEYFNSDFAIDTDSILKQSKKICKELYNFLTIQNFEKSWTKILKNSDSKDELRKQKIFWFDAFRTLKLLHHLRDNLYPNINVYQAINYFSEKFKLNYNFEIDLLKKNYQLQKKVLIYLREHSKNKL